MVPSSTDPPAWDDCEGSCPPAPGGGECPLGCSWRASSASQRGRRASVLLCSGEACQPPPPLGLSLTLFPPSLFQRRPCQRNSIDPPAWDDCGGSCPPAPGGGECPLGCSWRASSACQSPSPPATHRPAPWGDGTLIKKKITCSSYIYKEIQSGTVAKS